MFPVGLLQAMISIVIIMTIVPILRGHIAQKYRGQTARVQILALPLPSCMTLSK